MTSRRLQLVDAGDFETLFIEELFWSRPDLPPVHVVIDEHDYVLNQIAGFKGLRVWFCNEVPDRRTQRLIDNEIRKVSNERLLVFADSEVQEWRWLQSLDPQGAGQPRLSLHRHWIGRENPALDQRLSMISIGLDEEDVTLIEVLRRMRSAFDADRVTRAFYDAFITKQRALSDVIEGIASKSDRDWYSALLMNRLMFIYFMQRKLFMDNDADYLRNRLDKLISLGHDNVFYEFYRDFLIPMFHVGLGDHHHEYADPEIKKLVGDVPYINGGIFAQHELEAENDIHVPDSAFGAIFDLFDRYQWTLDDRETGDPNNINPDVLGYIFEQFINQKQQGAYYTKEDVTHFMTSNTLLPVVIERLEKTLGVSPWEMLRDEPERYIWASQTYGSDVEFPKVVEDERPSRARPSWAGIATADVGLPGESWWEADFRRNEQATLLTLIAAGEINSADEAVTQNIDFETLAVNMLDSIATPEQVIAAWKVLDGLRIVDPTCGSGAFLFAALKVLLPLYSAVLDAAHAVDASSSTELQGLLAEVARHPNADYYILKHASLANLYGVDIMKEAVEVARLRLFLKLVSTIDDKSKLEPLPDLDFNIKPGNILVGALTVGEIETVSDDLLSGITASQVMESAGRISDAFAEFRVAQESGDDEHVKPLRRALNDLLDTVRDDVNHQYYSAMKRNLPFDQWVETHYPFHWFIEFPEVFDRGGFDVVIGNPPYIAKSKVTTYTYKGFKTDALPDIYAPCTERASQITNSIGRFSLIVPISCSFGAEYADLRRVLEKRFNTLWVSNFSRNPAALFSAGLGVRSTILVGSGTGSPGTLHVTKTHRWYDAYRPSLFETLRYVELPEAIKSSFGWIRVTSKEQLDILAAVNAKPGTVANVVRPRSNYSVGFKQTALYWLSAFLDDPPAYEQDGTPTAQTKIGRLTVENETSALLTLALLASKFAFVWWYCTGDDFDVTTGGLKSTPIDPLRLSTETKNILVQAARDLIADFPNHEMFTNYARKLMGNFVHSEMRDITDPIDAALAAEFGYTELLPALELAYACVYKPTGDRPGTQRVNPWAATPELATRAQRS